VLHSDPTSTRYFNAPLGLRELEIEEEMKRYCMNYVLRFLAVEYRKKKIRIATKFRMD
jgi:hypothetical protein